VLILWEHPLSPYAQKVKIALREKGLEFEARLPVGVGSGASPDDFSHASPLAEVPALTLEDGSAIFDSTIILEYLEAAYPKPELLSQNAKIAAKARMIEEVMDTRYEAINWALAEIRAFRRAEGDQAAALEARAKTQIDGLNAWLERQLGGPWFCPPHFGWADLSVVPYVAGSAGMGMGPQPGSKLADWFARALDRPSVSATIAEARTLSSSLATSLEGARKAIEVGLFKRQYRDHRLEWMLRSGGVDIVLKGMETGTIRFGAELS
jgi:glutathione S-transferase/RNA polymerase-associated protein